MAYSYGGYGFACLFACGAVSCPRSLFGWRQSNFLALQMAFIRVWPARNEGYIMLRILEIAALRRMLPV